MDKQTRHAPSPRALDKAPERAFDDALDHARHVLPAQSPIGNFVHHNTLHAFQHLPFHEAVRTACALHDADGYLDEAHYRAAIAAGRVQAADLARAIAIRAAELGDERVGPFTRSALEALSLRHGLVGDADLPSRAPALWEACRALAPLDPLRHAELLGRVGRDRTARDVLCALDARDPNELTNPILIDFLGAYLDAGMARWPMPGRERGLLACFLESRRGPQSLQPEFARKAVARLERAKRRGHQGPRALALALLGELGVRVDDFDAYLSRALLALPGWTGMLARLEQLPAERPDGCPPLSLREFTAIRLALDVEAYICCARALGYHGRLCDFGAFAARKLCEQHVDNLTSARRLLQLCTLAEIDATQLGALGATFAESVAGMLDELAAELPRLLHEAYEHAHLREVLDGVSHHRASGLASEPTSPSFQLLFCIDDREESIRRYVEEADPETVTYGVAGFFGVAMRFRGIDDASASSLCPVVVEPAHAVEETAHDDHAPALSLRLARRSRAARLRWEVGDASRSFVRGLALTPLVGLVAAVPLTLRVLFPHLAERLRRWAVGRAMPLPRTQLALARDEALVPAAGELAQGFTVAEQAERVAGTLENVGLVAGFAKLVAVFGHGASTVNNPHHSAYDCGACGGRSGGPNARAFAAMANAPAVRAKLRERGIDIPDDCWFLGGLHDTTTDELRLFDLEQVPPSLQPALATLRGTLDRARAQSALERCRKFEHAPDRLSAEVALRHVEERAVDLSQARPELGHATNAVCIVGGRRLSRGLFMDRRSFLASYCFEIDPDLTILERILGAVVPVGANINLEYYFSTVDNEVWGCGTKLPHNLAGLLGVMEGSCGDLRTGLPRQMIEVHDPVRLLSIVEAPPEAILEVVARKPEVAELVTRAWVRVASVHPRTGAIQVFDGGAFRPYEPGPMLLPTVGSAQEWYRGKLGFLSPVRIVKGRHEAA